MAVSQYLVRINHEILQKLYQIKRFMMLTQPNIDIQSGTLNKTPQHKPLKKFPWFSILDPPDY